MRKCSYDSHDKYERLIGPLRDVARQNGYALLVHGTLVADIDLVACPWSDKVVDAKSLAEALRIAAEGICGYARLHDLETGQDYFESGCPGAKPHGRLVWSFHLGGGPYIDLSVMPRMPNDEAFLKEIGGWPRDARAKSGHSSAGR
jgi:hypothetical protein